MSLVFISILDNHWERDFFLFPPLCYCISSIIQSTNDQRTWYLTRKGLVNYQTIDIRTSKLSKNEAFILNKVKLEGGERAGCKDNEVKYNSFTITFCRL